MINQEKGVPSALSKVHLFLVVPGVQSLKLYLELCHIVVWEVVEPYLYLVVAIE